MNGAANDEADDDDDNDNDDDDVVVYTVLMVVMTMSQNMTTMRMRDGDCDDDNDDDTDIDDDNETGAKYSTAAVLGYLLFGIRLHTCNSETVTCAQTCLTARMQGCRRLARLCRRCFGSITFMEFIIC